MKMTSDTVLSSDSKPDGSTHNKDLEVSASPTPKVCPHYKKCIEKGIKYPYCYNDKCEGKTLLNPDIKRNSEKTLTNLK